MISGNMTQTEITAYIPQRAPFVMVDEVLQADEQITRTNFTIREGHLFVNDGHFIEPGLVENMAQSAGSGTGYRYQQKGERVPVGYIGAIKKLKIDKLPRVGDTITTEVSIGHTIMNVHMVTARVFLQGEEIASCELKIFEEKKSS